MDLAARVDAEFDEDVARIPGERYHGVRDCHMSFDRMPSGVRFSSRVFDYHVRGAGLELIDDKVPGQVHRTFNVAFRAEFWRQKRSQDKAMAAKWLSDLEVHRFLFYMVTNDVEYVQDHSGVFGSVGIYGIRWGDTPDSIRCYKEADVEVRLKGIGSKKLLCSVQQAVCEASSSG